MQNDKIKLFVRKCAEIGVSYHRWGWTDRIGWAAGELAGHHTYKGVAIPNDDIAMRLIARGRAIAARAEARYERKKVMQLASA